jgi:hypothetical protein
MRLNTCRFCTALMTSPDNLVKYGTRHYAHPRCYLKAGKSILDLPLYQIESFPYFMPQRAGL